MYSIRRKSYIFFHLRFYILSKLIYRIFLYIFQQRKWSEVDHNFSFLEWAYWHKNLPSCRLFVAINCITKRFIICVSLSLPGGRWRRSLCGREIERIEISYCLIMGIYCASFPFPPLLPRNVLEFITQKDVILKSLHGFDAMFSFPPLFFYTFSLVFMSFFVPQRIFIVPLQTQ